MLIESLKKSRDGVVITLSFRGISSKKILKNAGVEGSFDKKCRGLLMIICLLIGTYRKAVPIIKFIPRHYTAIVSVDVGVDTLETIAGNSLAGK